MILPELPDNYRWKIEGLYRDSWDAARVKLQKKTWIAWVTVQSSVASTMFIGTTIEQEVEHAANELWANEFTDSPVKNIEGVYYGDNQHRKK